MAVRETIALVLVASAATTVLPEGGWNATAHYALVEALADGTPRIDDNLNQTGDLAWVDGHFYAAKSPGLAMASVPLYAALDSLGVVPPQVETELAAPGAESVSELAIWQLNLVIIAAFVLVLAMMKIAADRVFPGTGSLVALLLGTGTMLLPFATAYFSHVLASALALAAFVIATSAFADRRAVAVLAGGVCGGFAVVVEQPALIATAAVGAYIATRRPHVRRAALFACGVAAGTLPLAAYNLWAFGSPLRTAYGDAVLQLGTTGHDVVGANEEGFFGLTYPHLDRLLDILVSERGLLVLTPVVVVAFAGLLPLARCGGRREAIFVASLATAFLLYAASYYLPFGGNSPGPRFLVPMLAFLAMPLAAASRKWPLVTFAAGAVSVFWMTCATLAGPLLSPTDSPTLWVARVIQGHDLLGSPLHISERGASVAFLVLILAAWTLVLVPRLKPSQERPRLLATRDPKQERARGNAISGRRR